MGGGCRFISLSSHLFFFRKEQVSARTAAQKQDLQLLSRQHHSLTDQKQRITDQMAEATSQITALEQEQASSTSRFETLGSRARELEELVADKRSELTVLEKERRRLG